MPISQQKSARQTKKHRNMGQSRDQNKTLETGSKKTQIYELSDKQFKITITKMLKMLNENTDN